MVNKLLLALNCMKSDATGGKVNVLLKNESVALAYNSGFDKTCIAYLLKRLDCIGSPYIRYPKATTILTNKFK
jgi:hypothetical protein